MAVFDIILFDADNTLFDFDRAEDEAIGLALKANGIDATLEIKKRYVRINQGLWKAFEKGDISKDQIMSRRFKELFEELSIDADGKKCNADYLDALCEGSFLIPGALELCHELSREHKLYIVTNGVSKTQHKRINKSSIKEYFQGVFVSEDVGYQKPQVEYFNYVFEKLAPVDKSRVLIVGDSLSSDIKGGINAGIATCWYNPKGLKNLEGLYIDYEIKNLQELFKIVR